MIPKPSRKFRFYSSKTGAVETSWHCQWFWFMLPGKIFDCGIDLVFRHKRLSL